MKIGIVGLGYVGLPLAVAFAEAGNEVVGLDADPRKVEALGESRSYVEDIPDEALAAIGDRLHPTPRHADLASCERGGHLRPDPADGLARARPHLSARRRHRPRGGPAARAAGGAGVDYLPGHDPRAPGADPRGVGAGGGARLPPRLLPRADRSRPHRLHDATTPKLVGGITEACAERARELYALICEQVIVLSTPEAAELSKLLENIFRSVNIALVNELAQLCDRLGIDVWEVIDAAATKPFGFMRFDPGPGMGGHCLPIDPFYLAYKAREHGFYPEFIELAGKVNQAQPRYCVRQIERALNRAGRPTKGSTVLILGVSYKAGIGDIRELQP